MKALPPSRRVFSLQTAVATALPLIAAAFCAAAQVPPPAIQPGIRVIEIKGAITPSLLEKIRPAVENVETGRFPSGLVVLLESNGGDGLVAIEIGRLLRVAKAHVFVRNRCASACVYVLAGGVVRGIARDRAIGIHSPRLTTFVKGIGVVDINAATNPNAAAALEAGNKRSREYFAEMGLPEALFTAMMATPSDQTRYLDLSELAPLGLNAIDLAYLAERGPTGTTVYKVSEAEYVRRTLAAAGICLADPKPGAEFFGCYRRVLRSGE